MLNEIYQQPQVIAGLIEAELENARDIGREAKERDIRFIVVAARGTSDNAGTYGKYLFEYANGTPVALAAPSIYSIYEAGLDLRNVMVIGISQSGEGADVNTVITKAAAQGAFTVGITNNPLSKLAQNSQRVMLCHAGEEKAVAATKTYTAELAALMLLSHGLSGDHNIIESLRQCISSLDAVLNLDTYIQRSVERYRYIDELVVLARGMNHGTALEIALKLQETSYVGAKAFSGADFLHGPFAVVEPGFPVMVIAPPGRGTQSMEGLMDRLVSSGAELIIISSEDKYLSCAKTPIRIPIEADELISPIPYIVAGQLFAYHLAITKGQNPDKPRSLTKVTSTL